MRVNEKEAGVAMKQEGEEGSKVEKSQASNISRISWTDMSSGYKRMHLKCIFIRQIDQYIPSFRHTTKLN